MLSILEGGLLFLYFNGRSFVVNKNQKIGISSCISNNNVFYNISLRKDALTPLDSLFLSFDLVNVLDVDSSLKIDVNYSNPQNAFGEVLYPAQRNLYLQPQCAMMLKLAHDELKRRRNDLRLVIFDAARPLYVQRMMWNILQKKNNPQLSMYLSDPDIESLHNYAAAVDLALADTNGHMVDMGTAFDHFGIESHIDREKELMVSGIISDTAFYHRQLLRSCMLKAGFYPIRSEWWHYNSCNLFYAQMHYTLIK